MARHLLLTWVVAQQNRRDAKRREKLFLAKMEMMKGATNQTNIRADARHEEQEDG
jgi:hypothetical protein